MLAGAFVQNHNYSRAEPLYQEVLSIRTKLSGENSDLAGAIYVDLGDLYVRKNELNTAEKWYRRSIAIGPRTGRGYTALATVLREEGRFSESGEYYMKALALRKKVYGEASKQYEDTKRGYRRLLELSSLQQKRFATD